VKWLLAASVFIVLTATSAVGGGRLYLGYTPNAPANFYAGITAERRLNEFLGFRQPDIYLVADVKTFQNKLEEDVYRFQPSSVVYSFGGSVRWRGLSLTASHRCYHDINKIGTVREINYVEISLEFGI